MKKYGILILIFVMFFSCGRFSAKKNAIGRVDVVTIMCSDHTMGELDSVLTYAVQDTFYFPSREENFDIEWTNYKRMDLHLKEKNLLIVVPYYEDSKGKKFINTILDKETIDSAMVSPKILSVQDPWAVGQEVVIILGDSLSTLKDFIGKLGKKLYWRYYYSVVKRESIFAFYTGHNKGDEKKLKNKYGYIMPLPSDYSIVEEKGKTVRIIAHFPDRLLLITPIPDTLLPTLQRAVYLRDSIAEIYYEGDKVVQLDEYKPYLTTVLWQDSLHPGEVLEGLWQTSDSNKTIWGGGPFFTYYRQFGDKIYMIDCAVWSPGKKKFPSLLAMRYLAESFKVEEDK